MYYPVVNGSRRDRGCATGNQAATAGGAEVGGKDVRDVAFPRSELSKKQIIE